MPCSLEDAISLSSAARVVTNAAGTILHTNRAWHEITGFAFLDAVGKGCDILHGPGTAGPALEKLHRALLVREPCSTVLVNYTKDGMPFRNHLHYEPVSDGEHWVATINKAEPISDGSVSAVQRNAELMASQAPLAPVNYADPEQYMHARKRARRTTKKLRLADVLGESTDPIVLCSAEYPHVIMHPSTPWTEPMGHPSFLASPSHASLPDT